MTIAGFWSKLLEYDVSDERVPFRIYAERFYKKYDRPLRVGIDVYMWLCELSPQINQRTHSNGPEVMSKLLLNFHSRIRELISLNVSFVFVFDGIFKVKKRRWTAGSDPNDDTCEYSFCPPARNFDEAYRTVNKIILNNPLSCAVVDLPEVVKMKELLDEWNISYVQAPAEAEAELGRLNMAGVIDAVISNDADGFMFGTQVILRNFSKWISDFPSTWFPTGHSITQQTEFYVTPISVARIEEKTGLTRGRIICVSCLSGNDFSEGAEGLGIVRAFHLAQIGTKCESKHDLGDKGRKDKNKKNKDKEDKNSKDKETTHVKKVDLAVEIAKIFVNKDLTKYTLGIPPDDAVGRKQKLSKLALLLNADLKKNSREYFGRAFNFEDEITLPSDFYFMIHFYPLLAPYIYVFPPYATNNAERVTEDGFQGCILPQICVCDFHDNKEVVRFSRGTNQGKLGNSYFEVKRYESKNDSDLDKYIDKFNQSGSLAWFERPDFKQMCDLCLPISKSTREFLLKFLSEAYIFRAVISLDHFRKNMDDVFVNSFKVRELPVKRKGDKETKYKWKTELYQLRYDDEAIFGEYLVPADKDLIYDDNYNLISSKKSSYVWIQKYLLESTENGRRLVHEYEARTKKKKETYKKGSPRKRGRRYPKQSTTLFNLKNSPIKLTPKKLDADIISKPDLKPLPALKFAPGRPSSKADGSQNSADENFWLLESSTKKRPSSKHEKPDHNFNHRNVVTLVEPFNKRNRLEKVPGLPRMESNSIHLDKEYNDLVCRSPYKERVKSGTNLEPITILDSDEETDADNPKTGDLANNDIDETSARNLSSSLIIIEDSRQDKPDELEIYREHNTIFAKKLDNGHGENVRSSNKQETIREDTSDSEENSSTLLDENDSAIHNAEDQINDILGL